jgi:hypothetical protein
MKQPARKWEQYADGELDVILSLVPTKENIARLAILLKRSESAVRIVYKIAYGGGSFAQSADVQRRKIVAAKRRLGIVVGNTRKATVKS